MISVMSHNVSRGHNAGRATVVRQATQRSINRSVPAINLFEEPTPRSSRFVRTAPRLAATNEFMGRSRSGLSRQPAHTSVVNFGEISLTTKERRHVRGVTGFYPSSVLRSGDGRRAGSVTPSSMEQERMSPEPSEDTNSTKHADNQGSAQPTQGSPRRSGRDDVTSRRNDIARREYQDMLRRRMLESSSRESTNTKESQPNQTSKQDGKRVIHGAVKRRDGAWVKAFKVRQTRNSKIRDLLESKSSPQLGHTSW